MSTPGGAGPSTPKEEKKDGFRKQILTRVKTLVKRNDGSRRFSILSTKGKEKATEPPITYVHLWFVFTDRFVSLSASSGTIS